METVPEHKEELIFSEISLAEDGNMEELRFSIDEEKYDDRRGQVLSLSGWYAAPGNRKFSFCLLGDGKERISLPEPEHFARPDVEKALNTQFWRFPSGFCPSYFLRGNAGGEVSDAGTFSDGGG